jgi:hypothetical protein
MIVFVFVLMGLAAYRATRFITQDSFPPVARLRARLIKRWSATVKDQEWAEGLTCPWCMGLYVSVGVVIVTMEYVSVALPALQILAVSCVVGLLGRIDD